MRRLKKWIAKIATPRVTKNPESVFVSVFPVNPVHPVKKSGIFWEFLTEK